MSGINNQPIVIVLNKHKINAANFIFFLYSLFFILVLNNMESQIFKITTLHESIIPIEELESIFNLGLDKRTYLLKYFKKVFDKIQ